MPPPVRGRGSVRPGDLRCAHVGNHGGLGGGRLVRAERILLLIAAAAASSRQQQPAAGSSRNSGSSGGGISVGAGTDRCSMGQRHRTAADAAGAVGTVRVRREGAAQGCGAGGGGASGQTGRARPACKQRGMALVCGVAAGTCAERGCGVGMPCRLPQQWFASPHLGVQRDRAEALGLGVAAGASAGVAQLLVPAEH